MQVYSAGLDNNITVWDLRKGAESMTLKGHSDSITGLALDPNGTHLLSNAADNSLRVWDLRPYAPANRCEKIFTGHQHNYERNLLRCSWSSDGSKVCCSSQCCTSVCYTALQQDLLNVIVLYNWMLHKGQDSCFCELCCVTPVVPLHCHIAFALSRASGNVQTFCCDDNVQRPCAAVRQLLHGTPMWTGGPGPNGLFACISLPIACVQVTSGSADRMVYVWNASTRQIEYKLPGHSGSVNDASFHPKEPIVASASSDKQIYLGELVKWS